MIGVGENDFSAQLFERFLPEGLNARGSAHGKKEWRLNHTVRGGQPSDARAGRISGDNFEGKTHLVSVSRGSPGKGHSKHRKKYVD